MPQMAPIWWTSMFMTFIISFMMMWTIMYFQVNYKLLDQKNKMTKMNQMNWKW